MNKILLILVAAAITLTTACTTTQQDSGVRQMVINHGAKVALTAVTKKIIDNNPEYVQAFRVTSTVLNELSWANESFTIEDINNALKAAYKAESVPQEQQDKILLVLSSGLGIYDEFMRANDYARVGQNNVLSALSSGIDNAMLINIVFENPNNTNPFKL